MNKDKSQSKKLEIIKRSLLEDSNNREKYLELRSEKGLVNESTAKERYLFNEKIITNVEEGETMTEKANIEVVNAEVTITKTPKPKIKKIVLSDDEKAKEKARIVAEKEKIKAKEKEKLAKEKAKEKEKLAKEKAKAKEKEKLAKEKEKAKEKARLIKEKESEKEKAKLAKEKEKASEKIKAEKEKIIKDKAEEAKIAKAKTDAEEAKIAKAKAEADEAKLAKAKADADEAKHDKAKTDAEEAKLAKAKADADEAKLAKAKTDADEAKLAKAKTDAEEAKIAKIKAEADAAKLAKAKAEADAAKIAKAKAEADEAKLVKAKAEADEAKLAKAKADADEAKLVKAKAEADEAKLAKVKTKAEETKLVKAKTEAEEAKLANDDVQDEEEKPSDIQEKMRHKIAAQKLLDQGFMKTDAERTQNKEISLKEKLFNLEEDFEESYDAHLDKEIEEAYVKIDFLTKENKKLQDNINDVNNNVSELSQQLLLIIQDKKADQNLNQELDKKLKIIGKEKEDLANKLDKANKQFEQIKHEFADQKSALEIANKKIIDVQNEILKKHEEIDATAEINSKLVQKEEELNVQKAFVTEAVSKIAELEVKQQELEQTNQLLVDEKSKLQESLKETKQKKAIVLSIKYDDMFILDKSGDDVSSELKAYLENIKKEKEDSIQELISIQADLEIKEATIVNLQTENEELKSLIATQKSDELTLFDERLIEENEKYDIEAEISKIKEDILQIKQREINTLSNNEQKYVIGSLKNTNQDIYQRIYNLEQEIYQKDQQIQSIRQRANDASEEKIINPEFKRKISRSRDIKKELNESFEEEKKFLNHSIIQVEKQISQKKLEVANANEKLTLVEKEYGGQTDRTSLGRESYLSKRGKALIELELFEGRLQKLDEELIGLKERYDYLVQCYDERMQQLNQSEKEIIDYHLKEMKSDLVGSDRTYNVRNEEKEDLIRQLNELNQAQQETQNAILQNSRVITKALETNQEIKEQILNDKKQNIDRSIRHLENDIYEENLELNGLIKLLNMINLKQSERVEAEKRIRTSDQLVASYLKNINEVEDLTQEYHDNLNQTQEITEKIDAIMGNPDEKSEVLRLRARLEDLDILKTDLMAKIDFANKKTEKSVNNEKVLYYSKLLESTKELSQKQDELKYNIEKLKANIAEKTTDLEKIKEEKFNL